MLSDIPSIAISETPYEDLSRILQVLHRDGPAHPSILENLALYKEFHPAEFSELEEEIVSAVGLFYKIKHPATLYSLFMSAIGEQNKRVYGQYLTPVQASVRRAVDENQFISISAPTSAGKSYSIRDFIAEQTGDAVIIVPSRALIAEYINSIKLRFAGEKNVMISPFVDRIFTSRSLRRIFILTPERARELFHLNSQLDIQVFFFDEAQVSEEKARGLIFDVLVRRIKKNFPHAKLIFAHPFVDNPDAQFKKHGIPDKGSYARSYTHGAVGKISVFRHNNGRDYYFTPHIEKGHLLKKCLEFPGNFETFAFSGQNSVLVFVSKASIYDDSFIASFDSHISQFPNLESPEAIEIIDAVGGILGADEAEHRSRLVGLLRKGVVVHHGSVPLEVRFLLEDFIRKKFARICFATSTLAQGINMPFDVVWLQSMRIVGETEKDRSLSFKNLIGRAGRLSGDLKFDYGYVYTRNPDLYSKRVNDPYALSNSSIIDSPHTDGTSPDTEELIDAIKNDDFNEDLNLPTSKVKRLSSPEILSACKRILDLMYRDGSLRENLSGEENKVVRDELHILFKRIFEASINRPLLLGEDAVFNNAIMIFLLAIGGRAFREIAGIRYSYISRRDGGRRGQAAFSQPASKLPDSTLTKPYPLFRDVLAKDVSYDAVVFDTYDYIDQVISFSLSDVFAASFKLYGLVSADHRFEKMIELLRFGTNNVMHMLLMRYGFSPEVISQITEYIQFVNEKDIVFKDSIESAPEHIRKMVAWYLP
ncbi:helicase [Massilia sp. KIM]|uniref:DEAD/DEAH box helicase n=1 Tax=Massilia sp. KIM TaxID=1955422 RepID=UPI00098F82C2|nr:DEAD/DEAH box helicase [Massilia sp. KIM]OON60530.1 helicase [Massilia sp. KIM]